MGFEAVALTGGYNAWRATQPVEPKHSRFVVSQEQMPEQTGVQS